jgi:hypothetical protein
MIGSVIEHPASVKEILKLPEHCLALYVLYIGYPKRRFAPREKWNYSVIVCKDRYKDIALDDVLDYWKKVLLNDLKRGGKVILPATLEKVAKERNYGKAYAGHYKEDFVKTTNKKLVEFLRKQELLRD